jgi:transcription elongation factor GreA
MEVILTAKGVKELEARLVELKTVKRAEVTEKIKVARSFGDLSENAEYDAAKDEQAMIEGEILEIEQKLKHAKIIDETQTAGVVHLGSKIKLYDVAYDESIEYTLVGTSEADPRKHLISNESPMGKALLGKKAGETVDVACPAGITKVKILEVE